MTSNKDNWMLKPSTSKQSHSEAKPGGNKAPRVVIGTFPSQGAVKEFLAKEKMWKFNKTNTTQRAPVTITMCYYCKQRPCQAMRYIVFSPEKPFEYILQGTAGEDNILLLHDHEEHKAVSNASYVCVPNLN